jgi:RimJ/RimL family protein N-acetyltransferase
MIVQTKRLILRPWTPEDLAPFAELNSHPCVREFFPSPLTRGQSDAAVQRYQRAYETDGFGFLAAELRDTGRFIGVIGMETLGPLVPNLPLPAVEIGWRLAYHQWGEGLATEGAQGVIDYAFGPAGLNKLVAITSALNRRSRRVMERLGMSHRADLDFDHPDIPEESRLRRHVLYELHRLA